MTPEQGVSLLGDTDQQNPSPQSTRLGQYNYEKRGYVWLFTGQDNRREVILPGRLSLVQPRY